MLRKVVLHLGEALPLVVCLLCSSVVKLIIRLQVEVILDGLRYEVPQPSDSILPL